VPPSAVVVVGASAGGVEALRAMVAGLTADLDAAVLVVLHIPRSGSSALSSILNRAGPLAASNAVDGEPLRTGHIYVAPADHHLLVLDSRLRLSRGPAENGHRPAVDPLFRSASRAAGPRTVAVVLSGSRDDGTAGAATVAERGGRVLVQDPNDALHASMPLNVIEHVGADRVCTATEMGQAVVQAVRSLAAGRAAPKPSPAARELAEMETAMANLEELTTEQLPAEPSGLACPTCHGGLFQLPGEPSPRYRCWVGHAWSPESLLEEGTVAFEGALWTALRSLEEKAALARRMAEAADRRGSQGAGQHYRGVRAEAEHAGKLIRELIVRLDTMGQPTGEQAN
jgi:two-component system, chemotaxis family, protein-glutamate methylesterase/glutaminase